MNEGRLKNARVHTHTHTRHATHRRDGTKKLQVKNEGTQSPGKKRTCYESVFLTAA